MKCNKLYILVFSAFILLLLVRSCKKRDDSAAVPKRLLQFNETWLLWPREGYFEIGIDLEQRKFRRAKRVENILGFEDLPNLSGNLRKTILEAAGQKGEVVEMVELKTTATVGDVVKILDVSPDGRWAGVMRKVQDDDPKRRYERYQVCLIDVAKTKTVKTIDLCGSLYFSSDSNACFFDEVLDVKKMDLSSGQVTELFPAQSFFMLPQRDQFLVFYNGEISLRGLDGTVKKSVGKYEYSAYEAGCLDEKWGYFCTRRDPKILATELFFINLSNYEVIKYPYYFWQSRLINIIPARSSEEKRAGEDI